jgi:hypothetical protein
MPIEIRMPQLFASNDEGTVARWLIKEGQQVNPGDVIAEIETDEATVEIEAIEGGRIAKLLVAEGTRHVKVNTPIALLDQGAAGTAAHKAATAAAPAAHPDNISRRPTMVTAGAPPPAERPALARTRLISTHEPAATESPRPGSLAKQLAQAKTEFIRGEQTQIDPVAGWVVVVKGPGRGAFRPVFVGMNSVGRDPSQRVCLSFGDEAISREEHAFITYDEEQRRFYVQHGGKANLVRLGKKPVLVPTELTANDLIRMGRTTLRFVPCCGSDFSWSDEIQEG